SPGGRGQGEGGPRRGQPDGTGVRLLLRAGQVPAGAGSAALPPSSPAGPPEHAHRVQARPHATRRSRLMKVAYLVNQYPQVSHSFIRREIVALEAQGLRVERFSVRPSPAELVDAGDRAERDRTQVLLGVGMVGLLTALLRTALTGPGRWLKALALTVQLGRRSERGVLRHLIYLAEACVLARRLRSCGAQHLHAHFGTNSAAVALLMHTLGGPPYSFTVHGPEEFDRPDNLSLGRKIEG